MTISRQLFGTVDEFVKLVQRQTAEWQEKKGWVYYRGVNDVTFGLLPGAIWKRVADDEDQLIADFLVSAGPRGAPGLSDPWETYALAQHYGLRTRLLDWTKSPLVGLFFALEGARTCDAAQYVGRPDAELAEDVGLRNARPVVWMLNPGRLNKAMGGGEYIFMARPHNNPAVREPDIFLSDFLPVSLRRERRDAIRPNMIVAIEPTLTNRRLVAQDGCFTVHGSEVDLARDQPEGFTDGLVRLEPDLSRTTIENLARELHTLGTREDDIYQDLGSLCRRINREYGFE